jgi:hypothetical protein
MRKPSLLATAAVCLAASSAYGVVLVDDTFSDTDRIGGLNGSSTTTTTTINTPTSTNTQWIGTRASQEVASATGMLWTLDASSRLITGYFPTVNLVEGTTTSFTLNFTTGSLGTGLSNGLRIALTNDGGVGGIDNTDVIGSTSATYVGDVGYAFFNSGGNVGGTDAPANVGLTTYQRTDLTSNNILGTGANWTSIGSSAGSTGNFGANTAYSMVFAFDYTGTQTTITTSVTGGNFTDLSYSIVDTTDLVTAFSQFSFRLATGNAQFATVNFTGFKVEQVSAVPEPSAFAALAGISVLGLAATRRRRTGS